MSVVFQRGNAEVQANLTPMIDMTFLLIVFFVLVSRIVEVERVDLTLPSPRDPATSRLGDDQRAVINIIPGSGGAAAAVRLGTRTFPPGRAGLEPLTQQLAELFEVNPDLHINLRADRSTSYEWVGPVLGAISRAAARAPRDLATPVTPRVNLVIVREE